MISEVREKMISYFGEDHKRIDHALAVAKYCRQLLETESGDKEIVLVVAYLHDIGIHEAEKKYNSSSGHYQEIEGPPIARGIMSDLGYGEEFIQEVCDIIAYHHTPGKINTDNFQILYEADWLVNLGDDFKDVGLDKKKLIIEKQFKTNTGKKIARDLYLK